MAYSNWRLCARTLDMSDVYWLVAYRDGDPQRWDIYRTCISADENCWFSVMSGTGVGGFPFGIPVEPDHV